MQEIRHFIEEHCQETVCLGWVLLACKLLDALDRNRTPSQLESVCRWDIVNKM